MILIKKYNSEDKTAWDEFVENSKNGTFMLKRDYMDYHSDRFVDFSLMFYEDDELIALLPASLHGNELRSHGGLTYGGFITNIKMKQHKMLNCFDALKIYLKENGIEKLIYKAIPHIYHALPSEEDLYALWRHGARLCRRDVSTTISLSDKIEMSTLRKRGRKKAIQNGLQFMETVDFFTFVKLVASVLLTRHNTSPVHTADELKKLSAMFPENIKLYGVYCNEEMIAGVVVFETPIVVHTQYIANSDKGRTVGALDLVITNLINLYSHKKRYFDFGISTENNGRYLNTGLISQKEGFGGRGVVYDWYEVQFNENRNL